MSVSYFVNMITPRLGAFGSAVMKHLGEVSQRWDKAEDEASAEVIVTDTEATAVAALASDKKVIFMPFEDDFALPESLSAHADRVAFVGGARPNTSDAYAITNKLL